MAAGTYKDNVINDLIVDGLRQPGWTQARLARELEVRPQTVNKWVNRENTPRIEEWHRIEAALGYEDGTFVRAAAAVGGGELAPIKPPRDRTNLERRVEELEASMGEILRLLEEVKQRLPGTPRGAR